ncbi:ABC transporter substrate-binding protein [Pseudoflavonifractor phocaeensis]|uniref:ABC transporter substrate-binding protein n=1 Tax=Pseudoflavonifractor phocaeensis TaxID=1870988 RepID=UPI001F282208|nr:ABC transporter substrate-binding protein [Pseudoflavonifractor phocaeensis]MCF2595347.1 ABC transporter substrate-binding protein [Pseudoflavonifractor phocaeensis]
MKNTNIVKKILSAALSLSLVLSLAACGGSGSGTSSAGGSASSQPQDASSSSSEAVKEYKVGIVKFMDHASLDQIEKNIQKELDAKSAELGVNFNYKDYTANGQGDRTTLNQIAAQMVADGVDVVVPIATPAAQAMQSVVVEEGIPVIFAAVSDPVTAKLVDDMDAPGGLITGVSDALNTPMIMDMMVAVDPDIQKVGLLYSKSEDSSKKPIEEAKAYLDEHNIAYVEKTGTNTDEINSAVDSLIAEGVEAIFTPTDNTVMSAELSIFEKLNDAKIPHYTGANSFALNGAFFGYGVDYDDLGAETADMVVNLLVNGADPATTPVVILAHQAATINTETCEAIGLSLDDVKAAFATLGIGVVEITTAKSFS